MKRIAIAIILAQASWHTSAVGAEGSMSSDPRLTDSGSTLSLDALMNPTSQASTGVNSLRAQLLSDGGRTVGFRGGLAARAQDLISALHRRERALDVQFEFGPLVSPSGLLPPVIVESRDVAAFSPDQIRMANVVYKKERNERFVSVPPTWRDYLLVGLPTQANVDLPVMEARPVDTAEMKIWQEAVKQGWEEGAAQAMTILEANFNRLTRDYKGMMLYSTLLQHNMVGQSQVAESQQTVTGDSGQLTLGDKMRRLVGKAEFEVDAAKWRPVIKVGALPPPAPPVVKVPSQSSQVAVFTPTSPSQNIAVSGPVPTMASSLATSVAPGSSSVPVTPSTAASQTKSSLTSPATPPAAVPGGTPPVKFPLAAAPVKALPVWETKDGSTLRETVTQWAKTAGWTVDWMPEDLNYAVPHLRIEGSFEDAVIKIFSYFQNAERPLEPKGSRQQKLIRVLESNPRKSA
ncbi:type IV secretory system conjugative DNA transfer family protein [Pseudomonas sp. G(2018)]|uniref:type IV secretory system conjugative DNA transfer family protein n=1 Tax=Pseudomonas sp. G(2018) TaxID=2502242 RepID=UPI0014851E78|nr:type IV secretory system conjugative DNA transfer family protein [Pseudomonas sp. G(2018)]